MPWRDLLEALLELASRADLEVRVLSKASSAAEHGPQESASCRVGSRIWVVLAPDDPPAHQVHVLAGALGRYRSDFLEQTYVAPAVRAVVDRAMP
jgi:hypothetical protein